MCPGSFQQHVGTGIQGQGVSGRVYPDTTEARGEDLKFGLQGLSFAERVGIRETHNQASISFLPKRDP